jgi:hypothetical protein
MINQDLPMNEIIDQAMTRVGEGLLPGLLGIEVLSVTAQKVVMRMPVARKLLAPR